MLDAVNQAILDRITGPQTVSTPTGTAYTHYSLTELYAVRDRLQAEIAAEALGASAGGGVVMVEKPGAGGDRW